ncbi:MAG: hypothetical protein HY909_22010, partial [Deltaproteobacteria bacterium]|nr:hypothetical protein [Deltaproteobacteria bacterium]
MNTGRTLLVGMVLWVLGACAPLSQAPPDWDAEPSGDAGGTKDNPEARPAADGDDARGDARGDTRGDGAADADAAQDVVTDRPGMDGGAREQCGNGLDDDNNGRVDDGCACIPGATQRCFPGTASQAGIGQCRYGSQRCAGEGEFGVWGACAGAVVSSGEACDGIDNDCDGRVDNGCECRVGEARECYTGEARTRGIGACRDGSQRCEAGRSGFGSAWGACGGEARPGMETCDGVDNDCNGTVDDGCACRPGESRRCYGGPAGTADVGVCRAGTQSCVTTGAMTAWGPCAMAVVPSPEVCDGMDNNCDGFVDDGCLCRPGATRPCYDGPSGTRAVGTCADGVQTCAPGTGGVGSDWGACAGARRPSAELCDDLDNNCDGVVDDGCACRRGESRPCYEGPASTRGVGVCRVGTQACVVAMGMASWGMCAGQALPGMEVCDGVDNDCNATVDDGCVCRPGESRMCYGGPPGTVGVGACRAGSQSCAGSGTMTSWGMCAGQ